MCPAVVEDPEVNVINVAENIRSDRDYNQSPINNAKVGIINFGSDDASATITAGGISVASASRGTTADYSTIPGGINNTAAGSGSFAVGKENYAGGEYTFVGGSNNYTNVLYSTVLGYNNQNLGTGSVLVGHGNTSGGSAANTLIAGKSNLVSGAYSLAYGINNRITDSTVSGHLIGGNGNTISAGNYNVVLGSGNTASTATGYSQIFGQSNTNSGNYSIVAGSSNTNSSVYNAVFGSSNVVTEAANLVFGASNTCGSNYALVGGASNYASSSGGTYTVALGYFNRVKGGGVAQITLGHSNNVQSNYSFAAGYLNNVYENYAVTYGASNVVSGSYSVALGNSNTILNGMSTSASVALGYGNVISSSYATAIGYSNVAVASGSVALGYKTKSRTVGEVVYSSQNLLTSSLSIPTLQKGNVVLGTTSSYTITPMKLTAFDGSSLVMPVSGAAIVQATVTALAENLGGFPKSAMWKEDLFIKTSTSGAASLQIASSSLLYGYAGGLTWNYNFVGASNTDTNLVNLECWFTGSVSDSIKASVSYDYSVLSNYSETITPKELFGSDLYAWYRADLGTTASGSYVHRWEDQSSYGHHLTQSVPTGLPTYDYTRFGGRAGLRFTSSAKGFEHTTFNLDITDQITVFFALKSDFSPATAMLFLEYSTDISSYVDTFYVAQEPSAGANSFTTTLFDGSGYNLCGASSGHTTSEVSLISVINKSLDATNEIKLYQNNVQITDAGVLKNNSTGNFASSKGLYVGARATGIVPIQGVLREVGIIKRALTDSERATLYAYQRANSGI